MSKKKNRRWANKAQREKMAELAKQCFSEIIDNGNIQEPIVLNKSVTRFKVKH